MSDLVDSLQNKVPLHEVSHFDIVVLDEKEVFVLDHVKNKTCLVPLPRGTGAPFYVLGNSLVEKTGKTVPAILGTGDFD